MEIKSLANTHLDEIVSCLVDAFTGYFVAMPKEVAFWEDRFKTARVNFNLSYGVFENSKLVAFIIHGVDMEHGKMTAFNTGTGVIEAYRAKQLVDRMYSKALPELRNNGIEKCKLEVIDQNEPAIKVYTRIGFQKTRRLKCFKGKLDRNPQCQGELMQIDFSEISKTIIHPYSWDHTDVAVLLTGNKYTSYQVFESDLSKVIGYVVINPENGTIAQMDALPGKWDNVLATVAEMAPEIRMNNVDENRNDLIRAFKAHGIQNTIDQFEMEFSI